MRRGNRLPVPSGSDGIQWEVCSIVLPFRTSDAEPMTPSADRLIDSFGRVHNNLRISVTDRCNIRCVYCMPESVVFLPRRSLLSFEEIERFVGIAATLGIDKIRLTGGEPLVRRDLPTLVEKIAAIPGIKDVG